MRKTRDGTAPSSSLWNSWPASNRLDASWQWLSGARLMKRSWLHPLHICTTGIARCPMSLYRCCCCCCCWEQRRNAANCGRGRNSLMDVWPARGTANCTDSGQVSIYLLCPLLALIVVDTSPCLDHSKSYSCWRTKELCRNGARSLQKKSNE